MWEMWEKRENWEKEVRIERNKWELRERSENREKICPLRRRNIKVHLEFHPQ